MARKALTVERPDGTIQATNVFPDEATLAASMPPDVAATAVTVPNDVEGGWIKTGNSWAGPAPITPPAPARKRVVDRQEFLMLIPASKEAAIRYFARDDVERADPDPFAAARPVVAVILNRVDTAANINLEAEANVQAAGFLVSLGLLTQPEADAILAGPLAD